MIRNCTVEAKRLLRIDLLQVAAELKGRFLAGSALAVISFLASYMPTVS